MISLYMLWLLTEVVIGLALVPMSAAKSAAVAQPHCLLSNCLLYVLTTPFNRYCCLAFNSGNAKSIFQPKLSAMSTNNISTDASANPTQVQKAASTRYSPLLHNGDSFRLLRVLPSLRQGSPIRCELFTSSILRERDKYIAGSYVWGPPEPTMSIVVDGKHFQVRENLFRFLKAFRSRYQSQVIWLDAICINQDDMQERSHQVQEMKQIYSGAKCVYSWLGYDKPLPHTSILNPQYVFDLYYQWTSYKREYARRRDQLGHILQAEYWSRMWIVQEFILAKEVQLLVGRNRLSYDKFREITRDHNTPWGWIEPTQSDNKMIALKLHRSLGQRNFESLFETFGMLPRSDPRDGVFALLGLLTGDEEDSRLISIADYSLTVWQLLQQILALDILKWGPFKFAEEYNRYVIKGQRDDYMGDYVGLRMEEGHPWRLCGADDSRYARTEGSSREMAMGIRASRSIMPYGEIDYGTVEVAMYTPRWRSISGQSGVSVELSWCHGLPTTLKFLYTHALVEACDSRCVTTCATHAVVGFSWVITHRRKRVHDLVLTRSIDVPLLAFSASGDVSQLIHNIQQRSMEMVEAISSKVRMTAGDGVDFHTGETLYKLETDVETMVILSTFIRDLETHNGWQGLLELAMDCIRVPEPGKDATRPK